jgi:hypothetical protein
VSSVVGWTLAVLAVALAWAGYGLPGVVLAVTVIVFWLLLQFSRTLRVLRMAGARPVGAIDNAVMLHARLRKGQRLLEILPITRSLGQRLRDDPETFEWADPAGDRVQVELVQGRLTTWRLLRAEAPPPQEEADDGPGGEARHRGGSAA